MGRSGFCCGRSRHIETNRWHLYHPPSAGSLFSLRSGRLCSGPQIRLATSQALRSYQHSPLISLPSLLPFPSLLAGGILSRHFAASLTPHARDLPNRRALMYSDWEGRSVSAEGAVEGFDTDAEGNRKLALRETLTDITTGIVNGSVVSAPVLPRLRYSLERYKGRTY